MSLQMMLLPYGIKGLAMLIISKQVVQNMPSILDCDAVCEACQYGKQSRMSFPTGHTWRAHGKLQLIYIDVWSYEHTIPQW